ncbi:MAG: tight adherence protein [Firmicutes bacterium]|nr:tight adherence protein [Bacillota bacterium]
MPLVIAMTTFIVILAAFYCIYGYVFAPTLAVKSRLSRYVELLPEAVSQGSPSPGNSQHKIMAWREAIRQAGKFFEWTGLARSIEHRLIQAGVPLRGAEFMAICTGVALIGGLVMLVLSGGVIFTAVAGLMGGYLAPIFWLRIKITKRVKAFNLELGDALTLMANSLRTGYSFLQSVEMVAREMPPPISEEFSRALKEMSLGVTTEEALNNLAKRISSDDLDLVITAVLIQRQVGGNLAEVLDNISGTIRARIKIKGEIKTLTAQGRISGMMICLLPIVLGIMLYLINPGYLTTLFIHPLGIMLLGVAVVSQVIGVFAIVKIVNIEV